MSWHLVAQMPTELVLLALEQVLILRWDSSSMPTAAVNTSQTCRARIDQTGAVPSFSRPGNPYDNALLGTTQAESG